MNEINILFKEEQEFEGRSCPEEYSCVEDMFYFINLALPFVS
jgi:hypothetical protein